MNHLAHIYLSCESPDAIIGAMLGDFVKGAVGDDYTPTIRDAILLHRAIDRFTDKHEITIASCALVSPARRRFAPILVDMFYDHFLARHWSAYHETPLPQFARQAYDLLQARQAILPDALRKILPYMAARDWLTSYAELEGIDAAVNGIARRLGRYPRAAVLQGAVDELSGNYEAFEGYFLAYLPLLRQYVAGRAVETISDAPVRASRPD